MGLIYIPKYNYWTENTIHFVIDSAFVPTRREDRAKENTDEVLILVAACLIQTQTGFRFVRYPINSKNIPRDYIHVLKGGNPKTGYSSSNLGNRGGRQMIYLTPDKAPRQYGGSQSILHTILHEFCHAIGLYHEMRRYDRDNYISIHKNNKANRMKSGKKGYRYQVVGSYDLASVMHYTLNKKPCLSVLVWKKILMDLFG